MTVQIGKYAVVPASMRKRVIARLIIFGITGSLYLIQWLVAYQAMVSATTYEALDQAMQLNAALSLIFVPLIIWHVVANVAKSTNIGGIFQKFMFVRTDTGGPAKGMVFLKYVVEGLFEGVTFGLGAISYLVSYRDGQHWIDRAFNVVSVDTDSVRVLQGFGQQSAAQPGPARVMPVQMPQRPVAPGGTGTGTSPAVGGFAPGAQVPAGTSNPGSPLPASATASPMSAFGVGGPQGSSPVAPFAQMQAAYAAASPISAPRPVAPAPEPRPVTSSAAPQGTSPFAPSNPWALGAGAEPPVAADTPVQAAPNPFAPTGQAPLAPVTTPVPAPSAVVSASLLDDETVIDDALVSPQVPVVVLDDGQAISLDGPVVIGRNPTAPDVYPAARKVQVVDESMRLSKTHLVVLPQDGGVGVYDVGATNGIHLEVDGEKARLAAREVHTLVPGAVLHFGGRHLRVSS